MPLWLRKFTFFKIKEFYEQKNSKNTPDNTIELDKASKYNIPQEAINYKQPNYTVGTSKK